MTSLRRSDVLFGAVLGAAYVSLLVSTAANLGFARDEGFYFTAADRYVRWLGELVDDPAEALRHENVDATWGHNSEHPPLMKTLFGLSHELFHEELGLFADHSTAYRFPAMLLAGLTIWLLYLMGTEAYGRAAGLAAAVAFGLAPRPFYHSHLACFDLPITAMVLSITYAYWKSLGTRRAGWYALLAGVLWGLGLLTKINALFVPATLLIHYVVVRTRGGALFPRVPRALLAMAILGPPIFVGLWPWLWHDTLPRIGSWIGFFRHHDYYTIEYLGITYFRPPFPLSYPWGMLLFTLPATTIFLVVQGAFLRGRALLPERLCARLGFGGKPDERRTDLLVLTSALVPILLIGNGRAPIFGGTKHFLPAVPFLALLAGAAFASVLEGARRALANRRRALGAATVSLWAALALPLARETAASHPFGLSHYNVVAGGTPGAADIGLCRQFWGFTTGSLTEWLSRVVRPGRGVQLHDTAVDSYRMFKRDGRLRADIRYAPTAAGADLALVHHEQHWAFLEYALWDTYRTAVPIKVLTHQGVPIVTVYGHLSAGGAAPPPRAPPP
ncbi:MAG: glycosyltransferase family 39 protein [Deltaproteobacteria bacterium]|nr:glycosyltransferase family 39 protein [Deltaproteobacteria bacterium]